MAGGVAVVEGRWESRGNYGVRPLFEMISALTSETCNPHGIRHDMFYEETSLAAVLKDITRTRQADTLYIASHGHSGSINTVSKDSLVNILKRVNGSGRIGGLYVATCSFVRPASAAALLDPKNSTGLQWIAGYAREVEWLESAAADTLFWSGYIQCDAKQPLAKAKRGIANLLKHMPVVQERLGFDIFRWSRADGCAVSLLSS